VQEAKGKKLQKRLENATFINQERIYFSFSREEHD